MATYLLPFMLLTPGSEIMNVVSCEMAEFRA